MPEQLLIRVDASARGGTGHVMRCVALAQAWEHAGGKIFFAQAEATPAIEQRLRTEGFEALRVNATPASTDDATQTIRFAREHNASWIVADGYHFDAGYQRHIKEAGLKLLFLDDYGHAKHYWADYVLNQNLSADPKLYSSREPHTQLLLGTKYVLLRKEFEKWRDWKRTIPPGARKVLVTLGGSDPDNVTGKVLDALSQEKNKELECVVVVGGSNAHLESLRAAICHPPSAIRLVVDATNMPELMAWADVAVAAGGTTSWELAFMGLPAIVLVLAQNQRENAERLGKIGATLNLGLHAEVSAKQIAKALRLLLEDCPSRAAMSERGQELVDGRGADRVIATVAKNETRKALQYS